MPFFEKEWEAMPHDQLHDIQFEKFKAQVNQVNKNSFIKKRFAEKGLEPGDIKTWEDIKQVPFMSKVDLRDSYPNGLVSGNWQDVVRVHMTSGTTGVPTPMMYSKKDLDIWTTCMARNFIAGGLKKEDIIQQSHGYGLFTGGFGFHYGMEAVGAKIIPTGAGGTERQLRLMREWGTTVFTGTPSYAVYIAEFAAEKGIDPVTDLKLRLGFHGGEPCSDELRERINERLGYKAHGGGMRRCYGLTEMGGPIAMDCEHEQGIHLWADHYLVEVLDPETMEPAEKDQPGELVISNLSFEVMPLLRYRTGDHVIVNYDNCSCGRTHPRITTFLGRLDDMILVGGTNIFPCQVEYILLNHTEISENWQIVVGEKKGLHTIKVEIEPAAWTDIDEHFILSLEKELHQQLAKKCSVEIKPIGSLPRFEGKAVRVIDHRS